MTPNPRESVVQVGHRQIFVTESGSGAPVVLLHGGGPGATGVSNFSRNIDALAQHHRVIVPDMPGYGRSTKGVDAADPFGDLGTFVRGLLDSLEIERAHLVGNSYGGAAALRCALDRPDRVDRLILMGPGGIGTTRRAPTRGLSSLLSYYDATGPSREKMDTFIRTHLVHDGSQVPDELVDLRYHASIDPEVIADPPLRRPSGRGALKTLVAMDFTRDERLRSLHAPTLVLWGSEDRVNRPSGAQMLLDRIPDCEVHLSSRTGHWFQWERPELFNRLTLDFLAGGTP